MSILIQSVEWNGRPTDLLIEGQTIAQVAPMIDRPADTVIDGRGKAVIPGLINAHTHAAMTLFRGYGDDMPLMPWLEQVIWPNEAKLTEEDVYWGAKLACLEMLRIVYAWLMLSLFSALSMPCCLDIIKYRIFQPLNQVGNQ